jgi:ParB-like chromosome segregation protein Spo0J
VSDETLEKLTVVYCDIAALIPYARNARTHSDAQIAEIAASVREYGWTNPVLIDEASNIIAGHGRVLAARQLGLTEVPTITLTGLTETQRRAYVLADNKLALNSGWDVDKLAIELEELRHAGYDLGLTGFGEAEVQHILAGWDHGSEPEETEPSDAPLEAVIKVRCRSVDADDLKSVVARAVADSGIEGARLVE